MPTPATACVEDGNTIGTLFTVTTFGESHGPAMGCIVDGCPPGLELSEADLQQDVDRRRSGTSHFVSQRREADRVPEFQDAWLRDHLVPLRGDVTGAALEAWTLLAALAAQTSRLRLGVIVTSNRIRPPAVLAKMAATVDVIASGRLVFGIGAGGSATSDPAYAQLVSREYGAYGIDIVTAGEALAALAETCTLVKRLWTEEQPFDFDGRCYQLSGAVCEPKPVQRPRPPIMIGSAGERHGLRIVAEHADIWSSPTFTAADFRRKNAVLDDHCAAIGRDPAEIIRSVQVFFTAQEPSSATARHPGPARPRGSPRCATRPRPPTPPGRPRATG